MGTGGRSGERRSRSHPGSLSQNRITRRHCGAWLESGVPVTRRRVATPAKPGGYSFAVSTQVAAAAEAARAAALESPPRPAAVVTAREPAAQTASQPAPQVAPPVAPPPAGSREP